MALVAFKDFCIDAVDAARLGRFWGAVLGLECGMQENGDAYLSGPTPQHSTATRLPGRCLPILKQRVLHVPAQLALVGNGWSV